MDVFARASNVLTSSSPVVSEGVVTDVIGLIIEGNGPSVGLGTTCEIKFADKIIPAEVVGFRKERILLMPLPSIYMKLLSATYKKVFFIPNLFVPLITIP